MTHPASGAAAPVRDIVVIGCSAGGIEALPRILQQLPPTLAAAVLIVQHIAPTSPRHLAGLLDRRSNLRVEWAEQGAQILPGRAYLAPPDTHLLVTDGHILLSSGARENHARPSIDKLFRSAATTHGNRVIGVLLTGMMEDGVAGLRAILDVGGVVIVQDPADAAYSELPSRAVLALNPDRVLPLDAIGAAIIALVGQPVGGARPAPRQVAIEAELDREGPVSPGRMHALGKQTPLSCPDCHGPLWEAGEGELKRYRCYLGHVITARGLADASSNEVESALWSAVRALGDRAITLETLAEDARGIGNGQAAESYAVRGRAARHQAELARQFMLDLAGPRVAQP